MIDDCLPNNSYTFVSDTWQRTSWLDHCFGPTCILNIVDDCWVVYDTFNSDHFLLAMNLNVSGNVNNIAIRNPKPNGSNSKLPEIDLN